MLTTRLAAAQVPDCSATCGPGAGTAPRAERRARAASSRVAGGARPAKSFMRSAGATLGREIMRGIFGTAKRRR